MRPFFIAGCVICTTTLLASRAYSEVWTQTNIFGNYQAVGSSADASVLVATGGRGIFISTNYGVAWRSNNLHGSAVTVSANGSNIIVGASSPGAIYTSTDAGLTWTTQTNPPSFEGANNVRCIAGSVDCSRLTAILYGTCPIFTSTDLGATWSTNGSPIAYWAAVTSSSDGSTLAAASLNSGIWVSTNSGLDWSLATISNAAGVASSADGKRLVAADPAGTIYASTNSGLTWTSQTIPTSDWSAVASSADGTRLAVAGYFGIYVSTNSGVTWASNYVSALGWNAIAGSADGHRWVATVNSRVSTGYSPPTPILQITKANGAVNISWPIPSSPLVLQQRTHLDSDPWSALSLPPTNDFATLRSEVMVPLTNTSSYFRLANP